MNRDYLGELPKNFIDEKKELLQAGITSWERVKQLTDEELLDFVQRGRATTRNLNRLRGMATLICEFDIPNELASLLLHSGLASKKAIASCTPHEIIKKAGSLERLLNTGRKPLIDLIKAKALVQQAKAGKY